MNALRFLSGLAVVAGLALAGSPVPAAADAMATPAAMMGTPSAMMAKPIDCSSASMMMSKMTPAPMMMKADASMDRRFVDTMIAHGKMAIAMAKVEAQCGKDPHARAMAAKMADELQADVSRLLLMTFP